MQTAMRPWITTGIAIVGASVIAVAPISPPPPVVHVAAVHMPSVHLPSVQLTASVIDIFTLPILRQYLQNLVLDYGTYAVALAQVGTNLGQAIGMIPETLRLLTQQLFSLDLQGALTTIETALVGTVAAVAVPIVDAFVTVRQRIAARESALAAALPAAIIGVGTGIFNAVDGVLRASIAGGQEVVDAVLTLNLGNIVNALVHATGGFLGSFVEGGQSIVDGIVFAQQSIADALAATPAPPPQQASDLRISSRSVTSLTDLNVGNANTMMLSTNSVDGAPDSAGSGSSSTTDSLASADSTTGGDQESTTSESTADQADATPSETGDEANPPPDVDSDSADTAVSLGSGAPADNPPAGDEDQGSTESPAGKSGDTAAKPDKATSKSDETAAKPGKRTDKPGKTADKKAA